MNEINIKLNGAVDSEPTRRGYRWTITGRWGQAHRVIDVELATGYAATAADAHRDLAAAIENARFVR